MKIAILGGGVAGLAAATRLSQLGDYETHIFESSQQLGGLAGGFWGKGWEWPLERAYHHIFGTDTDIIELLDSTKYKGVFFATPTTSSLYKRGSSYETYALDTPLNLLKFPLISFFDRLRSGAALALLKVMPHLPLLDRETTENFLTKTMGKNNFETLFGQMFRKKYGKYAGNILAAFIWSRIRARTKALGYMEGGFQSMIDHLEHYCVERGVQIHKNARVQSISPVDDDNSSITLHLAESDNLQTAFDFIISTLPSPILASVAKPLLQAPEIHKLTKLKYLSALNLIIETDVPVFTKEYWVSVCTADLPNLVFVQHTNFVDKRHYNNKHLLYISGYYEDTDPIMSLSKEDVLQLFLGHIRTIRKDPFLVGESYLWKAGYAQPIFDSEFLNNMPEMFTSHPRLFLANLDMTYPHDRGTNHAARLGVEVANRVMQEALKHRV
ncbi:MAG TPA: FAD-dependent oxidoreductase [Candidatus Woesebacteria bacterium]|nr:FAD-dependent oxidoreductase [Candidatus Woesebacteria bacterium]HNS94734.1 FAD-dependent oxidoreductase [Candidatus Woesebacteria bacterium]